MQPGHTCVRHTFVTHPWLVRDAATGARMMLSGAPEVVGAPEQLTVHISASAGALAPCVPVRLRSQNSKQRTRIRFANRSGRVVRVLWLDQFGHEVSAHGTPASTFFSL